MNSFFRMGIGLVQPSKTFPPVGENLSTLDALLDWWVMSAFPALVQPPQCLRDRS